MRDLGLTSMLPTVSMLPTSAILRALTPAFEATMNALAPVGEAAKTVLATPEAVATPTFWLGTTAQTFWLGRLWYLRWLGIVYVVANLVALRQNRALIGAKGLLPLTHLLQVRPGRVQGLRVAGPAYPLPTRAALTQLLAPWFPPPSIFWFSFSHLRGPARHRSTASLRTFGSVRRSSGGVPSP